MSKQLQKKIHEGDVIQSAKVLGVTFRADTETVQQFNEALERARKAAARFKEATRMWHTTDEKNIIDQ